MEMDSTDMTELEVEAQFKAFEREVEAKFKAFETILKSNIAPPQSSKATLHPGMAQKLCDQRQLKKENDRLQASVESLEGQFKKWQSVNSYLQNALHTRDGNHNEGLQGFLRQQVGLKVDCVDDSLCKIILDQLSDSIDQLVIEEAPPPAEVEESKSKVRSKPKKMKLARHKSDSGKATGVPKTRRSRLLNGSQLVNPRTFFGSNKTPIKYPLCLLCPYGCYTEAELGRHYAKKHGLDFGDTPLPIDRVQVDCLSVERDRQTSNKCNICRATFANLDQVLQHKSNVHLQDKFKRHICKECNMKFCLQSELKSHTLAHNVVQK